MTAIPVTITGDTQTYQGVVDLTITRTAFVTGTIVDDDTGLGLANANVKVDRDGAYAFVSAGGFFSVAGLAERLFPELATKAYALTLTISAPRHKPQTLPVAIPIAASFPIAVGVVRLRPMPVRLEGRVTRESNRTAIGGAGVALHAPAKALLLRVPSYSAHPIVNVTPMNMGAGVLRSLQKRAPAGALVMTLNSVAGFAGGTVLRFGVPPASEYAVVQSVDGGASTVTLRHPLWRTYPALTQVTAMAPAAAGAAVATTRTTDSGEALLFLAAAPAASPAVEISDVAARLEYHDLNAVADADGFFAIDGIAGAAAITLRASAMGFVDLDRDLSIDSTQPVAEVSFRLKT